MDRIKSGTIRKPELQPIRSRLHAGYIRILGRSVPIFEGTNIVGRSKKATVNIKNLTVSQLHALIVVINGTSYISDPGSSNCTMLNGTTLHPNLLYCLESGAELDFGSVKAIFMKGNEVNLNETAEPSQSFTQTAYEANTQIISDTLLLRQAPTLTQVLSENQEEFQEACNASFEFAVPGNNVSQASQLRNTVSQENGENNEAANSDVTSDRSSSPRNDIFNQQTQRLNANGAVTIDNDAEDKTAATSIHEMETQVIIREDMLPGVGATVTDLGISFQEAETQQLVRPVNESTTDLNPPQLTDRENEASEPADPNHFIGSEIDTPMLYRRSLSTENIIEDSMNEILPATQDDYKPSSPVFRMNDDELADEDDRTLVACVLAVEEEDQLTLEAYTLPATQLIEEMVPNDSREDGLLEDDRTLVACVLAVEEEDQLTLEAYTLPATQLIEEMVPNDSREDGLLEDHTVSPVFNQNDVIDDSGDETETSHKRLLNEVESQVHTSQLKRIVRYRLNSDEDEPRNSAESQVRMKRSRKIRDPFAEDSDEEPESVKPGPKADVSTEDDGGETDIEDFEEQNGKDEELNNDSNIIPATQDLNVERNPDRSLESNGETSQESFKLGLTQLDDEMNVSGNSRQNQFNEAITRCVSSTRNEEDLVLAVKSHDETCLHKNCRDSNTFQEDVYMMSTQKLVNKSIDDGIFEQATQKLHNKSHESSDDDDLEATQKIDGNLPAPDSFIKPTITPKKQVRFLKLTQEDDIYIRPTQKIDDANNLSNTQRREDKNMDESCYLAATQKLDTGTTDDSGNHLNEDKDADLAATQKLDVGTSKSENILESQSQFEVAFPTQTLRLVDSDDRRPSNPLLSLFETENNPAREVLKSPDTRDELKEAECEKRQSKVPKIGEKRKSIYILSSDDDDDDNGDNLKHPETEITKSDAIDNGKKDKCQLDRKEGKRPERREPKVVLHQMNEELTVRKSARSRRSTPKMMDHASTSDEAENKRVMQDDADKNGLERKQTKRKLLEDVNEIEVPKATPTRVDQTAPKRTKTKKQTVDAALEVNVPVVVLPKTSRNQGGRKKAEGKSNVMAVEPETSAKMRGVTRKASTTSEATSSGTSNSDKFAGKSNVLAVEPETPTKTRGVTRKASTTSGATSSGTSNSNIAGKSHVVAVEQETPTKTRGVTRKNVPKSGVSSSSGGKNNVVAVEPETPAKTRGGRRKCSTSSEKNESPAKNRKLSVISETGLINLSSPERSRRKLKPKVVFTMMDSPELESAIRQLGGLVVDDINSATVLVTESVKRSQKLLCAIGQSKPICKPQWLKDSKKSQQFLDPSDYILRDREAELKWDFSLEESLERSKSKKLLEGFTFYVMVTNAADVLKSSIEACGGKFVGKVPAAVPENFYVIASKENKTKCNKFRGQDSIKVIEPEAIFDGILRQELRFDKHILK